MTTYFFFHPDGRLLTEMVPSDEAGKDYIYLDETPLARVDWAAQELTLGDVLTASASSPNVHLDWTAFPAGSNRYVVRRKQIVDFSDKTFNGNVVIATPEDPTQAHDDPVLGDANDYFYRVFRRVLNDTLHFYHADHLGTPVAITDTSGSLVWRAEHRPFGGIHSLPVSAVTNNLRFPGQYFDSETGLHQNWFRDYDAAIGRYREPDPLGIANVGSFSRSTPADDPVRQMYTYAESGPLFRIVLRTQLEWTLLWRVEGCQVQMRGSRVGWRRGRAGLREWSPSGARAERTEPGGGRRGGHRNGCGRRARGKPWCGSWAVRIRPPSPASSA